VARQLLALQVLLLTLVVLAGAVGVVLQTRRDTEERARDTVLALALSVAASPFVLDQIRRPDPSRELQPYADRVTRETGVSFVVIMAPDRTRFTHPSLEQIGKAYIGTIAPALAGRAFTETYAGTLGLSVRAVAPVIAPGGRVVALVAVGITTETIGRELARRLPAVLLFVLLALLVALAGAVLVSRRLRRQTHGLGPAEITRMYEYYDSVLHSVREGLVLVDLHRRVQLVNDEARRLLGLGAAAADDADGAAGVDGVVGAEVGRLDLAPSVREVLSSGRPAEDELHLAGDRVLVVNQTPAVWAGHTLGTVTTLRDSTELQALTGELDSTRALAESLRSQAHEAANRLHTMVSLIELGRAEEAVEFATAELELAQRLTDRVVHAVGDPVLSALLLGKAAEAGERGVELVVAEDTAVDALPISARDTVTVVGNLVDNAIDAAADALPPRRVTVSVRADGAGLLIRVTDTGPGLDPASARAAFQRGWSTKPANRPHGRGLGLALVGQVVRRLGGSIEVGRDVGAVFTIRLPADGALPTDGALPAGPAEAVETP